MRGSGCGALFPKILSWQGEDGLWSCFAHQPETGPETSGSAGFCLGLLLAHELGLVAKEVFAPVRRCVEGLEAYLTPDGFLHGVTQSNKKEAGENLQRSGFRILSQMGLGMAVAAKFTLEAVEG